MDILDRIFSRPDQHPPPDGDTFLVAGLGNPGRKYKDNRHNIGFMAIDVIAKSHGAALSRTQNQALTADFRLGDHKIILAKPQTFMNNSGDSVGPLADFYKIPPERVLVIYDEIDLDFGTIRIREQGGSGGHNGMKSIINHLGRDFPRIRLGIGRPQGKMPVHAYVLQDFHPDEHDTVRLMLDRAQQAVETAVRESVTLAMSRHNGTVDA